MQEVPWKNCNGKPRAGTKVGMQTYKQNTMNVLGMKDEQINEGNLLNVAQKVPLRETQEIRDAVA